MYSKSYNSRYYQAPFRETTLSIKSDALKDVPNFLCDDTTTEVCDSNSIEQEVAKIM